MTDHISSWLRPPVTRPTTSTRTCCHGNPVSVLSTHSPLCLSVCQKNIHAFCVVYYTKSTIVTKVTLSNISAPRVNHYCKKSTLIFYKKYNKRDAIFYIINYTIQTGISMSCSKHWLTLRSSCAMKSLSFLPQTLVRSAPLAMHTAIASPWVRVPQGSEFN